MSSRERVVVGISGASGVIYGIRALELLKDAGVETHLVMSKAAELTLSLETDRTAAQVKALASVVHKLAAGAAAITSGSIRTRGMQIAPGSVSPMDRARRDGRDHRPAAAGLLRQARYDLGPGGSVGRPRA